LGVQVAGVRPTLALNMIVRGGGEALARAVRSVADICDEFVFVVDSRTWDETSPAAEDGVADEPPFEHWFLEVLPADYDTTIDVGMDPDSGEPTINWTSGGKRVHLRRHDWRADPRDPDDVGLGFGFARQVALDATLARAWMFIDSDDEWIEDEPGQTLAYARNLLDNDQLPKDHPERFAAWAARYVYSKTKEGRPGVVHNRERIFRTDDNWHWQDLIHETPTTGRKETIKSATKVRVEHANWDDDKQDRDRRNLKALYRQLVAGIRPTDDMEREEFALGCERAIHNTGFLPPEMWGNAAAWSESARTVQYIGFQHYSRRRFEQAEFWFRAFLDWPKHGKDRSIEEPDEWEALIHLARSLLQLFRERGADVVTRAEAALLRAEAIAPHWPDHWLGLADCAIFRKKWGSALFYNETARRLIKMGSLPHPMLFFNMLDYELVPAIQMNDIEHHFGNLTEALKWCEEGLAVDPEHKVLADYRAQYTERLTLENAAAAAEHLLGYMADRDDVLRARNLSTYLPEDVRAEGPVSEIVDVLRAQTEHLESKSAYAHFYSTHEDYAFRMPEAGQEDVDLAFLKTNQRYTWLLDRIPDGARILDLGCADGHYHPLLMEKGCSIVAVDVDQRALDTAVARAKLFGYEGPKFDTIRGLAEDVCALVEEQIRDHDLPRFDFALIGELIEHVIDPGALYLAAEKVAGTILLTTPDGSFGKGGYATREKHPRGHVRTFTKESLFAFLDERPNRTVVELFDLHHDYAHGWLCAETRLGQPEAADLPGSGKLAIIFCGPGFEDWTPNTYRWRGLGGSETAVVCAARELAELGWRVVVYAEADGVWDGVLYRHWSKIDDYGGGADHLILWRTPQLLHGIPPQMKAAERVSLWVHDMTPGGAELSPAIARRIDSILYLSDWHRNHLIKNYPFLWDGCPIPLDELFDPDVAERDPWDVSPVTREAFEAYREKYGPFDRDEYPTLVRMFNGVDHWPEDGSDLYINSHTDTLELMKDAEEGRMVVTKIPRNPHRIMWASSPDRGLDELLRLWPEIREAWPDAELHAYYGWETVAKWLASDERLAKFKRQIMDGVDKEGVNGVHWHGRVSARRLREEWAKSGYFLYPALPERIVETFCISVLEAQSAGCLVIVKDAGSLREVVGEGGIVVPWAKASLPELFEIARKVERQKGYAEYLRARGYENMRRYTWARAARVLHDCGTFEKAEAVTA
jgi:glycosyltransferase involved in cell wall biosynthesis